MKKHYSVLFDTKYEDYDSLLEVIVELGGTTAQNEEWTIFCHQKLDAELIQKWTNDHDYEEMYKAHDILMANKHVQVLSDDMVGNIRLIRSALRKLGYTLVRNKETFNKHQFLVLYDINKIA
ncbi:MAG: hypothetical protein JHC54_05730 [Acinetobacter sp.]|nr:hypothetical protein [Acinetobacter sp.]